MEPLTRYTGRGVALRRSDVDTDQIIPAEFCKRLGKSGYADVLFAGWRRSAEFVLNDPDAASATVLVAGHNFGTGSSREHAVWALRDWGFRVVVASSFGDIFRRNALCNGLLPVELPEHVVAALADLVETDRASRITVDLQSLEVRAGDIVASFDVDQRARRLLLRGLDDIDVTLERLRVIEDFEASRSAWLPGTAPGPGR
ncbi:3-isopropylmalate dehydratase small subunit [Streptomyces sp. NBC_01716]|uniref:3-isopropylmalate dehydratase small subunit n=1 Tax=Streptomyces sp. NBC_01716 TaxID=2975917 RepID=UPI002E375240|nr:3-isopropylmalate dehydratase small subunit [Streptomyces sp. NBC_01716]